MTSRVVRIGEIEIGGDRPLAVIAGPCVIESADGCLGIAERLAAVTRSLRFPFVFKASFDKANRSSVSSYRGPGLEAGLEILARVRREIGVPVLTDIHLPEQAPAAAEVVDILQIPAFLCRQTDLLLAAGATGRAVNIKKGQFLAPWDLGGAVEKVVSTGNRRILLTERGVSFGYNRLVVDMRSLPILRETGYPVVFDATHSVQEPGGLGDRSGGESRFAPVLARAAVAAGCDAVFLEVHPDPSSALSDGPNMIPLSDLPRLLEVLRRIHDAARS